MTRKVTFLLSVLALALPVVASATEAPEKPAQKAAQPAKVEGFGAPIGEAKALALADVLAAPENHAEKSVIVEGVVRQACTRKGCWMELAAPDGKGQGCRVTFKDYGFFVPLDSKGAKARLEGTVQVKTLTKAEVDHFEAEGASFAAKAADGSANEVRIVATGVQLTR